MSINRVMSRVMCTKMSIDFRYFRQKRLGRISRTAWMNWISFSCFDDEENDQFYKNFEFSSILFSSGMHFGCSATKLDKKFWLNARESQTKFVEAHFDRDQCHSNVLHHSNNCVLNGICGQIGALFCLSSTSRCSNLLHKCKFKIRLA